MELSDIIRTIAGKKETPVSRTIAGSFFVQGVIEQVFGTGGIMVNTPSGVVMAKPVTDEPLTAGTRVWVSSTADKNTWLIHGAVR